MSSEPTSGLSTPESIGDQTSNESLQIGKRLDPLKIKNDKDNIYTEEKIAEKKVEKKKKKIPNLRIFYGTFVHSTKTEPLVILKKWLVGVDNGKIIFSESSENYKNLIEKYKLEDVSKEVTLSLADGTFMIPGFVDAHGDFISLVSAGIQNTARSREKQQLINEDHLVNQVFDRAMTRSLQCGTTTVAHNGTHTESVVRLLANKCVKQSQHSFVGFDVAYPEQKEDLLMFQITKCVDVISHMQRKGQVAPQLIVSSPLPAWLEQRISAIQREKGVNIKVSLFNWERSTSNLNGKSLLQHHVDNGLISEKTIALHNPMSDLDELKLLSTSGVAVVYCPASDIKHGIFTDLRTLSASGVKLGLGTTDSGSLSVLDAIRQCVQVTKNIKFTENSNISNSIENHVTYQDFFRMATLGGAEVLNLSERIGSFEVGKDFDAILVDPRVPDSPFFVLPNKDTAEDILEKFIFCGDDRNITAVYIAGQRVK